MDYYDRQGKKIDMHAYAELHGDMGYKRVAEDTLPDGRWISTVWLGIDHQYGDGAPLIFETMVFPSKSNLLDEYCERYSTEEEALAGHAHVLERLRLGKEI